MNIQQLIDQVDQEGIYKIITDLEGPKHPMDNMDALNYAADYIGNYLSDIGVVVEEQVFYVKGFDEPFRNIIGYIGNRNKPAIVLGSHYDTVRFSPGANDNLSAVAVSLEVAKQVMTMDQPPSLIIAAFTLEEGHPGQTKYRHELLKEAGLINDNSKFVSSKLLSANLSIRKKIREQQKQTFDRIAIFQNLLADDLTDEERLIVEVHLKTSIEFDPNKLKEATSIVGSKAYVKKIIKENIPVSCIINYDCLGWIKEAEGTQKKLPITDQVLPFLTQHKMSLEETRGNYIAIAGDVHSTHIVENFSNYSKAIPHLLMQLPLDHPKLKKMFPDILRSDHSAFWEASIPGIFISDVANFRSELYHTPGDTSEHIDYGLLKKLTQATLQYIINEK